MAKGVYAMCPARTAHGKDCNQILNICAMIFTARFKILYICEAIFAAMGKLKIEHFTVCDCKAHGKMLSVRPRRQIGRVCGTNAPVCRVCLFAVCFLQDLPCAWFCREL
jgi:hypothetical protein